MPSPVKSPFRAPAGPAPPLPGPGAGGARGRDRRPAAHALRRSWLDPDRGAGLVMALLTLLLVTWHVARPALWLDEAASAVATQRAWPDLWTLTRGADAPLVPFYALLKVAAQLAGGAPPEIAYRWPSAVAVVGAGWALVAWLARRGPLRLALAGGGAFLLVGGVSRYGQEARPYALVLLGAVLATVAWTRMVRNRRRRWLPAYALAVAFMVAMNSLAAALIAAHLVAAAIALPPGERLRAAGRTLTGGALGVAVVAPLVVLAVQHGQGATRFPPLTVENLFRVFVQLFTGGNRPLLGLGAVLLLAVVGLARAAVDGLRRDRSREEERFVTRVAAAWALVPPALLLPAVLLRPNLLIGRYLLFTVPGWAVLAGLGLVTMAELARRFADGVARQLAAGPRLRPGVGPAAAVATAAVVAVGATGTQLPTLKLIRTTWGHGEDIRPALAQADLAANARLPIVVTSTNGAVGIGAYRRTDESRLIGPVLQRDRTTIWPAADPLGTRIQLLRLNPRVLLLLRGGSDPGCRLIDGRPSPPQIERCLSPLMVRMGYRVVTTAPAGRSWAFAVLDRTPPAIQRF